MNQLHITGYNQSYSFLISYQFKFSNLALLLSHTNSYFQIQHYSSKSISQQCHSQPDGELPQYTAGTIYQAIELLDPKSKTKEGKHTSAANTQSSSNIYTN